MRTTARLGLFGAGLVAVFGVAALTANALVPAEAVSAWNRSAEESTMQDHTGSPEPTASEDHTAHDAAATIGGLSLESSGYVLDAVSAPAGAGQAGELSFRILDPEGAPVTTFDVEHDKELHLIVVRSDGAHFRHVHPARDAAGTWSLPWTWDAAGTYRVYADFRAGPVDATLARTVEVAGAYEPVPPVPASTAVVDGYEVALHGAPAVGEASTLTVSVSRDGAPVTTLQPYLSAFGHLVALRAGDLGYLHVHPEGDTPDAGATAGPDVTFAATTPTTGRYLLYFDFQVDGQVHTAAFVVDVATGHGDTDHDGH